MNVYGKKLKSGWAQFIRAWRKSKNLYAKQAADAISVPFDTYRGWEEGKHEPHPLTRLEIERRMKAAE